MADNERRGRKTAVHCRGGIGRTGTVVGCWLVESGVAKDGPEALVIIAREWATVEKSRRYPMSPETGGQCEFVRNVRSCLPLRVEHALTMQSPLFSSAHCSTTHCNVQLCRRYRARIGFNTCHRRGWSGKHTFLIHPRQSSYSLRPVVHGRRLSFPVSLPSLLEAS